MSKYLEIPLAIVLLVLLSPVLIIVALLVRTKLGSPILFSQERPGKDGVPFKMYKFRSMTDARDANGELLPDDQRLPKFGQLLRSTSLDELPALFNVVRRELSIVGPRPLLVRYLPRYTAHQARRHEVLPGITGWAQVNGRNAISWEQKFDYDVWYVDNRSFALDMKILYLTVIKVLRRDGITSEGGATANEFMGNDQEDQIEKQR